MRLELAQPIGWATRGKLTSLAGNRADCLAVLDRAHYAYRLLPPLGGGMCLADQRTIIASGQRHLVPLNPDGTAPSCAVSVSLLLWMRDILQPIALHHFGQRVVRIENLGSYNCRRIAGSGVYSEHATGNAIDITAFILADGRQITLSRDWRATDSRGAFLHAVRDGSCGLFSTVLSPDFNAAHADHFHFDQADRAFGRAVCR